MWICHEAIIYKWNVLWISVTFYDPWEPSPLYCFKQACCSCRPWQIKFSVMYVYVLVFYIILQYLYMLSKNYHICILCDKVFSQDLHIQTKMSFIAFVDKTLLSFIAQLSLFLRQTLIKFWIIFQKYMELPSKQRFLP